MLKPFFTKGLTEAGCDEAGRGCLAGPVFAAAVILPEEVEITGLDDSKKLTEAVRNKIRRVIEKTAISYAVAMVEPKEIDEINILNASFLAMHCALDSLKIDPHQILVDGNRFRSYKEIPHQCIIKGDGIFRSIAAASILAKTYRDEYMKQLHQQHPQYFWEQNKGYPTRLHREAIHTHGITIYHRRSFRLSDEKLHMKF
ncbi:MAG: ribonuclease HII [Bacteroidales bacterium]